MYITTQNHFYDFFKILQGILKKRGNFKEIFSIFLYAFSIKFTRLVRKLRRKFFLFGLFFRILFENVLLTSLRSVNSTLVMFKRYLMNLNALYKGYNRKTPFLIPGTKSRTKKSVWNLVPNINKI